MSNIIPFPYQGQAIRFTHDGWINATDIAKRFGKLPNEWLRLPETQRYIGALAHALNAGESRNLVRAARGRSGGTWLHPKLAVVFARWLDVEFAVWCDMQIEALIHGEPDAWRRFEITQERLDEQNQRGSTAGRELARHRWKKPPLEAEVQHWRDQLQMVLSVDAA
ncbi:KilA-N domain-containing protein [Salinicola salarius]|uniref:KilA-N domain-containing protein n=1 Tax=Salinicola salarius TaxID=430457 RepID=UPI0023E3F7CC|nr:KilA-N domain-containing protein [Salinicola salarius]MDF3917516.1 KilA-N domain-containing protein [Salinicola salarius]